MAWTMELVASQLSTASNGWDSKQLISSEWWHRALVQMNKSKYYDYIAQCALALLNGVFYQSFLNE